MDSPDPGSPRPPAQRRAERDALLARITSLLRGDERVLAAWLHGSLGRGDADDWSDIDLCVVVADEQTPSEASSRAAFAARLGEPLLLVEAPQNAPPGGAFLSVVYPGPQHVDWTWQPRSSAARPSATRLLFDRVGVPPAPVTPTPAPEERLQLARKQLAFFWMMVPIAAKAVSRRRPWVAISLLTSLVHTAEELKWLAGRRDAAPPFPATAATPPPVEPIEQLAFISGLADDMEALAAETDGLQRTVPEEARRQIRQTLALARTQLA